MSFWKEFWPLLTRYKSKCVGRSNTDRQGHQNTLYNPFEPAHEITILFVLRKLILQTLMRSHPVGLDVRFFVGSFVYFHSSCARTATALVRLRRCAGSPEPSLIAYVISTIFVSYVFLCRLFHPLPTPYFFAYRAGLCTFYLQIYSIDLLKENNYVCMYACIRVCMHACMHACMYVCNRRDISSGGASASCAVGQDGCRFDIWPRHTKDVIKMVPVATLLGAQHYKASTGFSSLTNHASLTSHN